MDELSSMDMDEILSQIASNEEALAWYSNLGARGYDAKLLTEQRLAKLHAEIARRSIMGV